MSVVVWDIETQDKISDMPGSDREDQVRALQVSCLSVLVLDSEAVLDPERAASAVDDGEMITLWRDERFFPFEQLFELFDKAEVIASFNGAAFDHQVMLKYYEDRVRYQKHAVKMHDAFSRLRDVTTFWYKLDALLKANDIAAKTANGLQAISWWNEGKRDLLREYCEADVRQLARLLVLPELSIPNSRMKVPNVVFGLASAIEASRCSARLARKRPQNDDETGHLDQFVQVSGSTIS